MIDNLYEGAPRSRLHRLMTGNAWLILPTYNEMENIEAMVSAASEVLKSATDGAFRILVVDDGSPRRHG